MTNSTRLCPFCAEEIKSAAIICKHCGSEVAERQGKKIESAASENQSKSIFGSILWWFVGSQILLTELALFGAVLHFSQQASARAQTTIASILVVVFVFTVITGKGIAHFRHRGKALLFLLVAGFFTVQGTAALIEQKDAQLAQLRVTDPAAYLEELRDIDKTRWLAELRTLDPKAYKIESARKASQAESEHLAKCSDRKVSEAYVMIQSDVRRMLAAPSTADFPVRYGSGTRHLGGCLYQVHGSFDAQNGFGAMLRGTFEGTTRYFPDSGSWRTQSLKID